MPNPNRNPTALGGQGRGGLAKLGSSTFRTSERPKVKDQYVGDICDFFKYALLRRIQAAGGKLVVCWMLTESDGGSDGCKRAYLGDPLRRFDSRSGSTLTRANARSSKLCAAHCSSTNCTATRSCSRRPTATSGSTTDRQAVLLIAGDLPVISQPAVI